LLPVCFAPQHMRATTAVRRYAYLYKGQKGMDVNILLAVAGIIVSIGVGFGTFYLADKRARRNRWESAKETVLRDLSKSLGEGNVPDASVIKATIRSVLRSHNASDLSVVTLDEISDDLLRQITTDPFLDAERRKKLQNDVLHLKEAQARMEAEMSPEEKAKAEEKIEITEKVTWSTVTSLIAGIATSIAAAASLTSVKSLVEFFKQVDTAEWSKIGVALIAAVLTVLVSIISLFVSKRGKKK